MKTRIGITGGIGSGKSYVCNLLRQQGLPIYDCDTAAKRLMTESEQLRNDIIALVAREAYTSANGEWTLNKPLVAQYLFGDKSHANALNAVVHPAVRADFISWAECQESDIVAMESAILFESGFSDVVDKTIEVYAPKDLRLTRAMQRDNATIEQIEARMMQQMPEDEKRRLADFCIINDEVHDLNEQIEGIIKTITTQNCKS